MKRFAAVALREVAERRFVLVAAAAAAVLPFLVPFLPGMPAGDGPTVRSIVALTLACAFGLGGSLLVGASVVGRELAEKRLSFHFARPLAAPVVWGGKLVGGLALVLLSEAVVLLPASAASGEFPGLPGLGVPAFVPWALLPLAVPLFLLAWVGSVALRSRSPWLVVDLVLLVLLSSVPALLVRRLLRFGHAPEPSWAIAAGAAVLAALLAATLAQVAAGRSDPRRGHGAQSLTLWGLLLVATAAGAVSTERTIDPGVRRLAEAWAEPADVGGKHAIVAGFVSEGRAQTAYWLDLETREERLLPAGWEFVSSRDGSRVAVVTGSLFPQRTYALEVIDVASGDSTPLDLPEPLDGVALSDDGRRLAVVAGRLCRVVALPSLDLLASARVPGGTDWAYEPSFVAPDRVRLSPARRSYRESGDRSLREVTDPEVAELELPTKSVRSIARYPMSAIPYRSVKPEHGLPTEPYFVFLPSPDRSRVLVVAYGAACSVRLLEAETGRVLAAFDGPEEGGRPSAAFLADGRAVVAERVPEGPRLVVLSPDGDRLLETPLASGNTSVGFAFEPAPGLLGVGTRPEKTDDWDWSLLDLGTGTLRPIDVRLLQRTWWSRNHLVPVPGSPATRLAREKTTRRLVLFDSATGATEPLTQALPLRK
jgi:hypothetical protein